MKNVKKKSGCLRADALALGGEASTRDGATVCTTRSLNLRPVRGADGCMSLAGVGRPEHLCAAELECVGALPQPGGGEILVLWRQPLLWVLAPGESEPVSIGELDGTLYGTTLCGDKLMAATDSGMWQVSVGSDGETALRRAPRAEDFHGVSLRSEHFTVLRSTVASRTLGREYAAGETVPEAADARNLSLDLGEAYERLCAVARGLGCLVQPVLARYKIYDAEMHQLYCSAPVLLNHSEGRQCVGGYTLRSLDRRKVESYELTAQTWRVAVDIPSGLPPEAAYLEVSLTPQLHTYAPDAVSAVSLSRTEGDGHEFGHIALPGADSSLQLLRHSLRAVAQLERPICNISLDGTARTVILEYGSFGEVRAELKSLGKTTGVVVEDERLRRLSPPNSFTARHGSAGPAAVLWGGLRVRRYSGYDLQQLAATMSEKVWEGWIKVNFTDGTAVLWRGGGSGRAPELINPVLSYPSADAVNMVIGLKIVGETACEQSFTLSPDPGSGMAVYIHPGLMPFRLTRAEGGVTVAPAIAESWTDSPDILLLSPLAAPLAPRVMAAPGKGSIKAVVSSGNSQSAWDFGRSRFYAFGSGGIMAVNVTEKLSRLAVTPVDRRVVESEGAVTVADGNVWVVASGDLVKLQGHRAISVRKDCGYEALAWRSPQRELLGMRSDGTVEANSCDYGMSRFDIDYRLGVGKLYSPHGGLVALSVAGGVYNLAKENESNMLDVDWTANVALTDCSPISPQGIVADMYAGRFNGTVSIYRRNGAAVAPGVDLGLIVRGEIRSPLVSRMICRPGRGWQVRIAGNATNISIRQIRVYYEKYTGNTFGE